MKAQNGSKVIAILFL